MVLDVKTALLSYKMSEKYKQSICYRYT